ncbi:hypothetical protein NL676_031905 [Syzygium grande]|nr:hypothetical protein NL676_031905 [Syzygium grande]
MKKGGGPGKEARQESSGFCGGEGDGVSSPRFASPSERTGRRQTTVLPRKRRAARSTRAISGLCSSRGAVLSGRERGQASSRDGRSSLVLVLPCEMISAGRPDSDVKLSYGRARSKLGPRLRKNSHYTA